MNFSDVEALEAHLEGWKREIHTSFPAKVLSYDVSKQTVDVRPAVMRSAPRDESGEVPISYEQFPDIYAVQLMWPRSGGCAITFPINVGDWVLVQCAENSTMVWRQRGGAPSKPGLNDEHGLNGLVALPGWFPDCQRLTDVSPDKLEIRSGGATVVIGGESGSQYVALSNLVEEAIAAAIAGHTHGGVAPSANPADISGPGVLSAPVPSTAALLVRAV